MCLQSGRSPYQERPDNVAQTIDEKIQEDGRMPEMVTDRNLITEYKYGRLGTPIQLINNIWTKLNCVNCDKTTDSTRRKD